jgi:hypothetical protein
MNWITTSQKVKHKEWYTPGYGTEKVGPFLGSLVELARPQKVLEIGFGYTTPFLLEGLRNCKNELVWDGNCDKDYLNKPYEPKLVVIDDQSLEEKSQRKKFRRAALMNDDLVDFIEGDFKSDAVKDRVKSDYPNGFDLVWFDCGGPKEYEWFMENWWDDMVNEYALFHFTYFRGELNSNGKIIDKLSGQWIQGQMKCPNYHYLFRMDIVEPHKFKQGSVTMLKKSPRRSFEQILSGSLLNE